MDKVYIITKDTSYMDGNHRCIGVDTDVDKVFSSMESCFNEVIDHIQRYFDMLDLSHKENFDYKYLDWEGNVDRESVVKDLDEHCA